MEALPGPPLRLAVLGDFDGPHTRRWLRVFVERGHDVHAISFYAPREALPGVTLHVLRPGARGAASGGTAVSSRGLRRLLPADVARLLNAMRYRRAGLKAVLESIRPDVFHAHYAVEHGFYGALTGVRPYVVSAWGSDLLVESRKPLGKLVSRFTLSRADLVIANDPSLAQRALDLGVSGSKLTTVRLGIDDVFFAAPVSVNLSDSPAGAPVIVSDRALEPLYNVDVIMHAFALLRRRITDATLVVAHDGSERARLEALAGRLGLGAAVRFVGKLAPSQLAEVLAAAHVYVSAPSSDSFALSNLEAMACGAFPVLSNLPSVQGMVEDGKTALLVPPGDIEALRDALVRACEDATLRRDAVEPNQVLAKAEANLERNMLRVEREYYRLARHTL